MAVLFSFLEGCQIDACFGPLSCVSEFVDSKSAFSCVLRGRSEDHTGPPYNISISLKPFVHPTMLALQIRTPPCVSPCIHPSKSGIEEVLSVCGFLLNDSSRNNPTKMLQTVQYHVNLPVDFLLHALRSVCVFSWR